MLGKHNFVRVAENIWEIPPTFRDDMRVPARVYADEYLLDGALADNSVVQLVNTATLPGVIRHAIAMPDIHQGYGFPIGGVVATRLPEGVISPGGVGYDINCGVRLLVSLATAEEIRPFLEDVASSLYANCPSGVGSRGPYCMAGIDFRPMIAYKDGRFVCRDCAHTVRPGEPEYGCTCRPCLRLSRKPLLPNHGSRLVTQ